MILIDYVIAWFHISEDPASTAKHVANNDPPSFAECRGLITRSCWCTIRGDMVVSDSKVMKLVITKHDVLIIKTIRKRRYSMAEIAANAGLRLTNTHGKVTAMCAKGFMTDSYRSDSNRTGLRAGEKRRVYEVTALGLQAATLFQEVSKSVEKVGAERKASPRSTAKKK